MKKSFNPDETDVFSVAIGPGGEATVNVPITAAELGAKDGIHGFPAQASEEKIEQEVTRKGNEKFGQPALRLAENEQRQAQCEARQQAIEVRRQTHQQDAATRTLALEPVEAKSISWARATVNMVLVVGMIVVGLSASGVTPTTLGVSALVLGAALLLLNWPIAGSILRNALTLTRYGYQTLRDQVVSLQLKFSAYRIKRRMVALQERQVELAAKLRECGAWIDQETKRLLIEYHLHRQWAEKAARQTAEKAATEKVVHADADALSLDTRAVTTKNGYVATDGRGKNVPQQAVESSGASP